MINTLGGKRGNITKEKLCKKVSKKKNLRLNVSLLLLLIRLRTERNICIFKNQMILFQACLSFSFVCPSVCKLQPADQYSVSVIM